MSDSKNFGKRLKEARKNKNLTRDALAKIADLSSKSILLYEQGERYPALDIVERLANALDVTIAELVGEEGGAMERARKEYGNKGARDLQELLDEVTGLFSGGELPEEDKDVLMSAFTEIYFMSKVKNRWFTPKKYRKDDEEY